MVAFFSKVFSSSLKQKRKKKTAATAVVSSTFKVFSSSSSAQQYDFAWNIKSFKTLLPPLFGIVTCEWVKKTIIICGRGYIPCGWVKNIPKKAQSGTDGSNKMFGQPPRGEKSYTTFPAGKNAYRLSLTTILY